MIECIAPSRFKVRDLRSTCTCIPGTRWCRIWSLRRPDRTVSPRRMHPPGWTGGPRWLQLAPPPTPPPPARFDSHPASRSNLKTEEKSMSAFKIREINKTQQKPPAGPSLRVQHWICHNGSTWLVSFQRLHKCDLSAKSRNIVDTKTPGCCQTWNEQEPKDFFP